MNKRAIVQQESSETKIEVTFGVDGDTTVQVHTDIPFLSHMLTSFAFHGGFYLDIKAHGDVDVDPHHLVEDVGLALGSCIHTIIQQDSRIQRFAWARVPMDDALCETIIDLSNRPYCVYRVNLSANDYAGTFPLQLLREFFTAMSNKAAMNLHLHSLYGHNGHHIAEALFKSCALALSDALQPGTRTIPSTKGVL